MRSIAETPARKAARPATRIITALCTLLALVLFLACGATAGQPEEDYRAAMASLYAGDLWGFYGRLAPASYTRDLNALLDKTRTLLDEEEYGLALEVIQTTAQQVQEQLDTASPPTDQAGLISSAVENIPESLGIETWQKFQQADVESLIRNLQESAIGEALRDPNSPVEWSRQEVVRIDVEGGSATLRVGPADGPGAVKTVELVKIDDKWVPADVARTWEARIEGLNSRLEAWIEAKQSDPEYVKKRLAGAREQLDMFTALIPLLLLQMQQEQQMEQR